MALKTIPQDLSINIKANTQRAYHVSRMARSDKQAQETHMRV